MTCFTHANLAVAQGRGISILRDAEIEQIIRDITEPIFIAGELDVNAVDTYLLNDNTINAFVMGGQNVFINSGLLLKAENVNQVIGVVAHETGHITGGHLSRLSEGMSQMASYSLMGMLLGVAAMAAGSADAGMALMMGGQQVGYRTLLRFTRNQESSADQAAITLLDKTGQSGRGLIEFFEILGEQDLVPEKYRDPYASTHPLTSQRIDRVRDRVQESPFYDAETDPELEAKFQLLQAKLFGYLKPLHATLVRYPKEDKGLHARYARTFGYQQAKKIDEALVEIEELIEDYPENPFFHETLGQILFEDGRIDEAIIAYDKAVNYLPESGLLRLSLARSQISSEQDKYLENAIENLEYALEDDPNSSFGWQQASIAYHRLDNQAMTHYATAQHFLLTGDVRGAMINAKKAVDMLPKDSPKWVKAQDILMTTEANMSDRARKANEKRKDQEREQRRKERHRSIQ
ncbi:M48 family metalloprotease [Pseudemcibacter aquimaris]|uniref:M48 family metalloprotease n=1 Tax=Pseudemcibacter aquimaris TaxID=2857064 RepID=UPI0020131D5F|nr:M48 family metalloprotease [Pseudemcibacter aquimaris]MCC3860902.1 M48 family metalloprotease [Pseudemcibacter aquimaris]WDU59721.1 M48 family metalloprotease [Pseudemcibacter aquimaris]